MPTELEELVEFLHHGNTRIRQIATENLVPFSKAQPELFKTNQLKPVKDLKVLVRDYTPIAKDALTILTNISSDEEVLDHLVEDDAFIETMLRHLTNPKEPLADDFCMLLANLSKSPYLERLIALERSPVADLSPSKGAIAQLIELFNKGANKGWNKDSTYDYLAYVFADLARSLKFITYLTTPPASTPLDPLTLFLPHTTHSSPVRRLGVASLLKNIAFIHSDILYLLQPAQSILPPLLLPLCNSNQDGLSEEDMDALPEECQYLTAEHRQEKDLEIVTTHLETLYLLANRGGVEGRRVIRERGTYLVIRELHLQIEDEGVRRGCERIVDILLGDEIPAGSNGNENKVNGSTGIGNRPAAKGSKVTEVEEDEDEDNAIVPIF